MYVSVGGTRGFSGVPDLLWRRVMRPFMKVSAMEEVALAAPLVGQPICPTMISISGYPSIDNAVTTVSCIDQVKAIFVGSVAVSVRMSIFSERDKSRDMFLFWWRVRKGEILTKKGE